MKSRGLANIENCKAQLVLYIHIIVSTVCYSNHPFQYFLLCMAVWVILQMLIVNDKIFHSLMMLIFQSMGSIKVTNLPLLMKVEWECMADLDPSDLILMFLFGCASHLLRGLWAMGMANVERGSFFCKQTQSFHIKKKKCFQMCNVQSKSPR